MWYLATDEINVFHYSELAEGAVVTTTQPKLVYFETKEELITELENYGQEYNEPVFLDSEFSQLPPEE
mgnify:CR=1 FL=1|jgi:hypothetical protein